MKAPLLALLIATTAAPTMLRAQTPRSLFRTMAPSDPNRNPAWAFWENTPQAFYYHKDGQVLQSQRTRLPYFDNSYAALWNTNGMPDAYPGDGWMLVMRDFGTPQAAPFFPYFILYNKYRGVFRLFILNTQTMSKQHYTTSLEFHSAEPQHSSALLTFSAQDKPFLKDYDPRLSLHTMSNMAQFGGWSHYDFVLAGYDPSLTNKPDASLYLRTNGINESSIQLDGNIYGTIEQLLDNAPVTFARSDMDVLEAALKKGYSYYKTTEDKMKALKAAAEKPENKNKWWVGAALRITAAYFSGGTSEYVPFIAGAIGFISEWFGGKDKSAPMQPMNFNAELALKTTGTITSTTWLESRGFYLNQRTTLPPGTQTPVQSIPWGVFNVDETPEVTIQIQYGSATRVTYEPDTKDPDGYWVHVESYPEKQGVLATVTKMPVVYINPDTGMSVHSIRVAYSYGDMAAPSPFTANHLTEGFLCHFEPIKLAFEIKFDVPNPAALKHRDPVQIFYKSVPIKKVNGPSIGWFEPTVTSTFRRGVLPY